MPGTTKLLKSLYPTVCEHVSEYVINLLKYSNGDKSMFIINKKYFNFCFFSGSSTPRS